MALLEASTLTPLAGVVSGLDHTDSLLNIQADGTIFTAPGVSITPLTSSPSPRAWLVDIDLTGLPAGTAARLSFDLLGFGDRTSTVVIDNVLLTDGTPTAAPVAVNDSYTIEEGASRLVPLASGLFANDPDADTPNVDLSAALITGPLYGTLTLNADGSFTYVHNGSETVSDAFTYQVSDGINLSNLAIVSLTITPTNDAPTMAVIPNATIEQSKLLTFAVVATDVDVPTQTLTYSLGSNAPAGATIDPSTGVFQWRPTRSVTPGPYQITVRATDSGTPALFAERTFSVLVEEGRNTAPELTPIVPKSVNEETELRFTVNATDVDVPAQPLTFTATGLPADASFDPITREFRWMPTEAQGPGAYQVTFEVSDGELSASETVTITVNDVNVAPVLTPIGPKSVNEETELRFTISGSDVDDPAQTLVFSADGLPTGASFDPTTHEFVWTPTESQGPGTYTVTFSVTDGVVTTSEAVTITVGEVNVAPVLAPIGPKGVNEESELRFTISGSDVDVPTQPLTFSATGLPAGATFDPTSREFAWTPTEAQGPGTYNVTFSVSDGVVTTSELVTLTVGEVNVAPVLAPIGNKTITEGSTLTFTASATDADIPAQPLAYSLAPSAPSGASIDPTTGVFTWTPPEGPGASPYHVTVQVSDGVVTTSETIGITVLNVAPTVSLIPATTVQEGVNSSYQIQFQEPGILDTHTVQIDWGDGSPLETMNSTANAAGGLTFARSHTYAENGTYPITVTVTDDDGAVGQASASVAVANVAPTVTVTPTTQSAQYSDPITPIVITATDVPTDTMNISVSWSTDGTTFTAGLPDELTITGGPALTGAANQVGMASWTISGVADLDPANTYQIRITVADEDGGSTVRSSVIDIDQEEARVTYDGVLYASTPSITTPTTTIQLRATVQDLTSVSPASDADAGLITNATVTFVNRETGAIIAANVPVTLLNPADPTTGTAVYNWTVTLPNNSNSESYTIGMIVNGFSTRNVSADNTVVTVSLPQNDFLTGGGYLVNQSSAGTYAGDVGEKTNFGFNVKFNKQLTNLQGKATLIIRQGGQSYQIKTNATNSLSTTEVSPGVYDATFTSKATLTNITDPLNPISLGGNLDLIVTLRDAGEPGTADTIGITLWRNSELLYSSHWTGTQTVQQFLGGGNLQVRKSSPLLVQGGALAEDGSLPTLTVAQLAPIAEEARARWVSTGLTTEQQALLSSVNWQIADLEGATIGLTDGTSVLIDRTAAGYGWFVDPTLQDHAEFHFVRGLAAWIADAHSLAFGRMDLLTTVLHELGHVLGFEDQSAQKHSANVMTETLPPGVRRSLLADSMIAAPPVQSSRHPRSPGAEAFSVKELLGRSLQSFAGAWGNTGSGTVATTKTATPLAVNPMIDWTEGDGHRERQQHRAIGASAQQAAWLTRFVSRFSELEDEDHPKQKIEVVLPGKNSGV